MNECKTKPLILNGKSYANEILAALKSEIENLRKQNKRLPGLAVILVGENPASLTYVKNKENATKKIGLYSEIHR